MGTLDLIDVAFSHNNDEFIRNLSISLDSGRFIGLIGANGSGKSTILKLAAGILKPKSGEILLWRKQIQLYKGKDRAKLLSYLPQMIDFNVPFKVKELVSMGLYPYDILPQLSTEQAISMVGLKGKINSLIWELSGGERRRVFIAMTLLQGAGILLLDEPLANLDIKYQIEFIRLLKELKENKDISILMALHDINMAFQFDHIYVIKNGKVIDSGSPESIITTELLRNAFDVDVNIYQQSDGSMSFGY